MVLKLFGGNEYTPPSSTRRTLWKSKNQKFGQNSCSFALAEQKYSTHHIDHPIGEKLQLKNKLYRVY
jgi:hypothetical protein